MNIKTRRFETRVDDVVGNMCLGLPRVVGRYAVGEVEVPAGAVPLQPAVA